MLGFVANKSGCGEHETVSNYCTDCVVAKRLAFWVTCHQFDGPIDSFAGFRLGKTICLEIRRINRRIPRRKQIRSRIY